MAGDSVFLTIRANDNVTALAELDVFMLDRDGHFRACGPVLAKGTAGCWSLNIGINGFSVAEGKISRRLFPPKNSKHITLTRKRLDVGDYIELNGTLTFGKGVLNG